MAKRASLKGMKSGGGTKNRGRTNISGEDPFRPTNPHVPQVQRMETSRPVKAGSGKHRGDRRDTSRTYTTTTRHKARGNSPRPDVKTRKR